MDWCEWCEIQEGDGGIGGWYRCWFFQKPYHQVIILCPKNLAKPPRFFREEMASNGDIVIHMKATWFGYIWMCCLCWSSPAKSSRVNAGRKIVDPDKIGRWGSTWKRSDFLQVHNSISSSMYFEASRELTVSSWRLERLYVFLNWYFLGWKSEQFDWDICGYLLNLFRHEGADNASMMGFCFTKELVQWPPCKSKPYYYIHKHSTICYNYYNMCCRSCSDISNLPSLEQNSIFMHSFRMNLLNVLQVEDEHPCSWYQLIFFYTQVTQVLTTRTPVLFLSTFRLQGG